MSRPLLLSRVDEKVALQENLWVAEPAGRGSVATGLMKTEHPVSFSGRMCFDQKIHRGGKGETGCNSNLSRIWCSCTPVLCTPGFADEIRRRA